ncbi:MAG: pyridoxamine 5'-phosphate oxidase family protein [Candidatus Bathyarchaeota archaeon]|jgi:general stress protein 26
MKEIEGMAESFRKAKIVYLTTFEDGEERSRPMTNFNEDPYKMFWFPTDADSRKVQDIKENPKVVVTFPSKKRSEYYEITGRAEFEDKAVTEEKWEWWYLYWHPGQRKRFWFPARADARRWKKMIINIHPESARVVKG